MKKQLQFLILLAFIAFSSSQLNAQDETFDGNTDVFWSNTANWTNTTIATGQATINADVDLGGVSRALGTVRPNFDGVTLSNGTFTLSGATNTINLPSANITANFNCDVTLGSSTVIRNNGNNSVLNLNGTLSIGTNTLSINNSGSNAQVNLNGTVTGTADIDMMNGELTLGSSSDLSGFTGDYQKDRTITSNTTSVFVNSGSFMVLDAAGLLTVNGENTIEGDITRSATTAGAAKVTFNAIQNNMGVLSVDTNTLDLYFDSVVTLVQFSGAGMGFC